MNSRGDLLDQTLGLIIFEIVNIPRLNLTVENSMIIETLLSSVIQLHPIIQKLILEISISC